MPEIIVILGPQGQIEVQVPAGSFATGQAAIAALLATLGDQMPLVQISDVEAHRPEDAAVAEQPAIHRHPHLYGGPAHGQ